MWAGYSAADRSQVACRGRPGGRPLAKRQSRLPAVGRGPALSPQSRHRQCTGGVGVARRRCALRPRPVVAGHIARWRRGAVRPTEGIPTGGRQPRSAPPGVRPFAPHRSPRCSRRRRSCTLKAVSPRPSHGRPRGPGALPRRLRRPVRVHSLGTRGIEDSSRVASLAPHLVRLSDHEPLYPLASRHGTWVRTSSHPGRR